MTKRFMILACCVACSIAVGAQPMSYTEHIGSADGLSNDFVVALAIDGQEHLWVATEVGVNRIAGRECQQLMATQLAGRITSLYWHADSSCQ